MISYSYTGNLNASQKLKLANMWEQFFDVLLNPEEAKAGRLHVAHTDGLQEHHHAHLSKEDQSKEDKAVREEEHALKDLFNNHDIDEFYNQFWFLCGPDHPDMVMLKFLRARKVS